MSHRLLLLLLTAWSFWFVAPSPTEALVSRKQPLRNTVQPVITHGVAMYQIAQTPLGDTAGDPILQIGSQGAEVNALQRRLTTVGYYDGPIDGSYGAATQAAVIKFQEANQLPTTGKVDLATWDQLQKIQLTSELAESSPEGFLDETPADSSQPSQSAAAAARGQSSGRLIWWLVTIAGLAAIAGGLFYILRRLSIDHSEETIDPVSGQSPSQGSIPAANSPAFSPQTNGTQPAQKQNRRDPSSNHRNSRPPASVPSRQQPRSQQASQGGAQSMTPTPFSSPPSLDVPKSTASSDNSLQRLDVSQTTRLSKVNIVGELIKDLDSPDPAKRRKAIWELGQRGTSEAVQPLVNLMMDSDSKQRSLILAALSEIGIRTLKPMNRALAISLQDQNPEVRKNAIRDLTRIYDMVGQISHLLKHAADDDPDQEVRETAHWALGQLQRIRASSPQLPETNNPRLQSSQPPPANPFDSPGS